MPSTAALDAASAEDATAVRSGEVMTRGHPRDVRPIGTGARRGSPTISTHPRGRCHCEPNRVGLGLLRTTPPGRKPTAVFTRRAVSVDFQTG
jgi:hypothetical protein